MQAQATASRPILLPDCAVHGRLWHPPMYASTLPPGPCDREAIRQALSDFHPFDRIVGYDGGPVRPIPYSPAAREREEEKLRVWADAVWLAYCSDPPRPTAELAELLQVSRPSDATRLVRNGSFRLRAALGPWGERAQAFLGAGTRLGWALYGCAAAIHTVPPSTSP